jgi:hypothetical protein
MKSRSDLARRVAELERAKAPPQPLAWSPWQRTLTAEEDHLCAKLSARGAWKRGEDPAAWRDLCEDARELALLSSIAGKAATRGPANYPLGSYLVDLAL